MPLSGNISDYFIVFWSGVLVSFTPCVYPLMPLTAGFIGGVNTRGTRIMGFWISLLYVLGMAVTYCALGAAAALSGKIFGQMQNHPAILLLVGNMLLVFALIMLDVIPLPVFGAKLKNKVRPKNLWTVFLFGLVSGLVVGPCTAPVLGTLLLFVASKQNILHGVSLLFVFSYGVGASLILVGTFSGILTSLPRSGAWLVRIKQACAGVLFIMAEYYIFRAGGLF